MASSALPKLLFLCIFIIYITSTHCIQTQDQTSLLLLSDAFEWPSTISPDEDFGEDSEEDADGGIGRRSLFWRRVHYYISYGALSANRIPCPPRSGRSYYTHNCYKARGPVHPYSRGCSRITRCRR